MRIRRFLKDPLNVVALLAGAVWVAVAVFGRPIGDYGVETDFYGDIVPAAREWARGHAVVSGFRGPFHPIAIGILGTLVRDFFLAGKLLSAVSAAVALRLAGGLLRRLWNPTVGLCGALFLSANAQFALYTLRACTDLFFLALFVGVLSLLLHENTRARRWALAGGVAGLAWLTRYNGLALLPGAAIIAFAGIRPVSKAFRHFACFAGVWVIVGLPWALYLWHETGTPLWNTNFQNIAMEVYGQDQGVATLGRLQDFVGFQSIQDVWAVDPMRFLATMGTNVVAHVKHDVLKLVGLIWAAAAVLGIALCLRSWRDRRRIVFAAIGAVTYLSLVPVFYNPRFMLPLLVWWAAGAGMLCFYLTEKLQALGRRRKHMRRQEKPGSSSLLPLGKAAVFVVLGVLSLSANGKEIRDSENPNHATKGPPIEIIDLAQTVQRSGIHIGPTTPIAARKPHIGYYLNAPTVSIPFGALTELRKSGAHYLLVSGIEVMQYSTLAPLLWLQNPAAALSGLRLVTRCATATAPGEFRYASLYAIADPLPWAPSPNRYNRPPRESLPGLTRLESLRVLLARWYLAWEPTQAIEPLVARLSPAAQELPLVLQLKGDIALSQRNLDRAEKLYQRSLDRDPKDRMAILRIATCRYLRDDEAGFGRFLERFVATSGIDTPKFSELWREGTTLGKDLHDAAAIALFVVCASAYPDEANFTENLGLALKRMGWPDRAERVCVRFLEISPGEPRILMLLEEMKRRRAPGEEVRK